MGTSIAGNKIVGNVATIVLAGSFINNLIGEGIDNTAMNRIFINTTKPAKFHISPIFLKKRWFVKHK